MSNLATVLMLVIHFRPVNSDLHNNAVNYGDWHVYNSLREHTCARRLPRDQARDTLASKTRSNAPTKDRFGLGHDQY